MNIYGDDKSKLVVESQLAASVARGNEPSEEL